MKAILTLFVLFFFGCASAQHYPDKEMQAHMKKVQKSKKKHTIIWDMDTVFVSGMPYCIVIKERSGPFEPYGYSIRSLQNNELIYVSHVITNSSPERKTEQVASDVSIFMYHPNTIEYYTWCFTDTLKKAETSTDWKVFKMVAENQLIEGNHLNKQKEAAFIGFNGMQFTHDTVSDTAVWRQTNNEVPENKTGTAQQDNVSGILILSRTVSRNNIVMGTVKIRRVNEEGTVVKIMSVYLPDGKVIAEGKAYGINSTIWKVITLKDNTFKTITSFLNNDSIDVMKYLADEKYL